VSVGNIVQGLCVYLVDRDLSADGEAQDDGAPMINTVTDNNSFDVVGIEVIAPVNVIGEGVLERTYEARVIDFEHGEPVFSQVGIVEEVANPDTVYFEVFDVAFGTQLGVGLVEQSVNITKLFVRNGEREHFAVKGFVDSFVYSFVLNQVSDNLCVVLFGEVVGKIAARDYTAGNFDCFEEYFGLRTVAAKISPGIPVVPDEGGLVFSIHESLEAWVKFSEQSFDCFHRLLSKTMSSWLAHISRYFQQMHQSSTIISDKFPLKLVRSVSKNLVFFLIL